MDLIYLCIVFFAITEQAFFIFYAVLYFRNRKNEKQLLTYPITSLFFILIVVHGSILTLNWTLLLIGTSGQIWSLRILSYGLFILSNMVDEAYINFLNGPAIPVYLLALSVQRSVIILADETYHKYVYVLMHLLLPAISVGFYTGLLWKIHKMQLISNSKKTVELNIILQTLPIILITSIRIFVTAFYIFFGIDDRIDFSAVCSYKNYLIFIPLGYIFGNVDRLKWIRRLIRQSSVSDSTVYANSTLN
ncbi:unnamed protein product [Caenorhabditis bovis]|uniref:Uncharacterized protein n=1 Tax=Caenorhabditis bovis TaxID=2654633 RepID=A0A8S1EN63_9PELO|nr:unnamed protein product [Caenorhabditis bovis]